MRYLSAADYATRAGDNVPRVPNTDTVDTARIEAELDDSSGTVMASLPEDLLDADGTPIATLPPRLAQVVPGIVYDLARFKLQDGATGAEDPVTIAFHAAIALLKRLKRTPERPGARAALVEGTSGWIDNTDAATPSPPRRW